jgi:predicted site-specific integrase-resolvase
MFVSIGEAANLIGVAISTLRRWEYEGKFLPDFRTCGGHRRYALARIQTELMNLQTEIPSPKLNKTIADARVSSFDQKEELVRQQERLLQYCQSKQ